MSPTSTAPSNKAKSSWRDVLPVHPAAELFPLMPPDELRELGEDIKKHGLKSRIVLWAPGTNESHGPYSLLDGRNRLDAMEAVGIRVVKDGELDVPPTLSCPSPIMRLYEKSQPYSLAMKKLPPELRYDPWTYVVSANIHRRHLTAGQRRDLIATLIKQQPNKSDRQIAKDAKSNRTTVGQIRKGLEDAGTCQSVDTRTDTKGRQQPAHRSRTEVLRPGPRPVLKDAVATCDVIGSTGEAAKGAVFGPAKRGMPPAAGNGVDPERSAELRKAEAIEEPGIEDEIEDPANYHTAFLLRVDQAIRFAVYSGPVTKELATDAHRVAAAWTKLASKLAAAERPADPVEEINAIHRELVGFLDGFTRRFNKWRGDGPLVDKDGKAALMQALYLCADGFARLAQEFDGR